MTDRTDELWAELKALPPDRHLPSGKPDGFKKECPAHEDVEPSLSVWREPSGEVKLRCFAGCDSDDVIEALPGDLTWRDRLPPRPKESSRTKPRREPGVTYRWLDGQGKAVTQERSGDGPDKRVRWMKGATPSDLLYRPPDQIEGDGPMYVVEGAKAADAMRAAGYKVVAFASASSLPSEARLETLDEAGEHVVLADNDPGGIEAARTVARRLLAVGRPARVVLPLAGMAGKADAADVAFPGADAVRLHEIAGGAPDPEARARVEAYLDRAPGEAIAIVTALRAADELDALLAEHIHFPDERVRWAAVLWAAVTHCIDVRVGGEHVFDVAPYIWIKSAARNSGKSTLAAILCWAAANGRLTSNLSPSALFRGLDGTPMTPFFDEADNTFRAGNRDEQASVLLAVINGGTTREGSVERVSSGSFEVERFDTFGPKALVGITVPIPDTTSSRCIHVTLERAKPGEVPRKFRRRQVQPRAQRVRDGFARSMSSLGFEHPPDDGFPELDFIVNRDYDLWEALYVAALAVGGEWPGRCLEAARHLTKPELSLSLGEQLLSDIYDLFMEVGEHLTFMSTKELLGGAGDPEYGRPAWGLLGLEDAPWSTYRHGRPLTAHGASRLLKPFGIEPAYQDLGHRHGPRGYFRADITAAWERWLPNERGVEGMDAVDAVDEGERTLRDQVRAVDLPRCQCGAPLLNGGCGNAKRHQGWERRSGS